MAQRPAAIGDWRLAKADGPADLTTDVQAELLVSKRLRSDAVAGTHFFVLFDYRPIIFASRIINVSTEKLK